MAKGFGGMPGNMQDMLKQAQKMQQDIAKMQEEAQSMTAEGSAGGGMVTAVANGKHQIESVAIDKEVVNPDDIEMLQDLVAAAANEALRNVQEQIQEKMSKITGGMSIPGMPF